MLSPTHVLFSLGTAIALTRLHHLPFGAVELIAVILGALLPDIDKQGSVITEPGTVLRRAIPYALAEFLDAVGAIVSGIVATFSGGHRGVTHTPILWLTLLVYAAISHKIFLFWLAWGAIWHVAGDMMTISGVPALFPLSRRRYSLKIFATGDGTESLILILLFVLVVVTGYPLLPDGVKAALAVGARLK